MAIDWNKLFPPVEEEFQKHGFLSQPVRQKREPCYMKRKKQARKRQKLARRAMRLHQKG